MLEIHLAWFLCFYIKSKNGADLYKEIIILLFYFFAAKNSFASSFVRRTKPQHSEIMSG